MVRHVSPSFDLRVTFRKSNISSPLCAARPVPDQGTQIATKATFGRLSFLHNLLDCPSPKGKGPVKRPALEATLRRPSALRRLFQR
ncbi:MAG: hypothetical protein OIF54_08335, partial [Cohaesibacter sp.]|nr:hypothetical protein [Cohaesibacter sp.]